MIDDDNDKMSLETIQMYYGQYWHDRVDELNSQEENDELGVETDRRLLETDEEDEEETKEVAQHRNETIERRLAVSSKSTFDIPGSPSVHISVKTIVDKFVNGRPTGLCTQVEAKVGGSVGPLPLVWGVKGGFSVCEDGSIGGFLGLEAGLGVEFSKALVCKLVVKGSASMGQHSTSNRRRNFSWRRRQHTHHRRRRGRVAMTVTAAIEGVCSIAYGALSVSAEGGLPITLDPIGPCGASNDWTNVQVGYSVEACGSIMWMETCYSDGGELMNQWLSTGRRRCVRRRRR